MLSTKQNEVASSPCEQSEDSPGKAVMNKADENDSSNAIGSPLLASSPSRTVEFLAEGSGDHHSLRSVQNLLSPIHSLRSRQLNRITMKTGSSSSSPNSPPAPVNLDSFLANFESSPLAKKPYSLEQELLLSEKISHMEESEARKLLTKVLVDNLGLRKELQTKDRRITAYKGQMLAILDWKARQECERESNDGSTNAPENWLISKENAQITHEVAGSRPVTKMKGENKSSSEKNMIPQKTLHSSHEITMVEEAYGIRRSLSFIQELASSIDVDHEMLKDRLKDGCYLTNQLLLGGIAGWLSALFVKKFGKLALSATGGGLILLVYTARKGFVNVNYESIYQEISKFCDNVDGTASFNSSNNDSDNEMDRSGLSTTANCDGSLTKSRENMLGGGFDTSRPGPDDLHQMCAYDKLRHAKNWVTSHTYTVGGFVLTFVYNLI